MKYDWVSLKRKFITRSKGDKKYSLKKFAEDEKINYSTLRENAKGWVEERATKQLQKSYKLTEKILEQQIESELNINKCHYYLANQLLGAMDKSLSTKGGKSAKTINTLAKALKTLQEVQRTAGGLGKQENSNNDVIEDFIKAVMDGTNNGNEDPNQKV